MTMLDRVTANGPFYSPPQPSSLNPAAAAAQSPPVTGSGRGPSIAAPASGSASTFLRLDPSVQAFLLQLQSAAGTGEPDPPASSAAANAAGPQTGAATTAGQGAGKAHHHGGDHHGPGSTAQGGAADGAASSTGLPDTAPPTTTLTQDLLSAIKSYGMLAASTNPAVLAAMAIL
jgi:hypothetical protein